MKNRIFPALVVALALEGNAVSQRIERQMNLTPSPRAYVSHPLVVAGEAQKQWLVLWEQDAKVKGRTVSPNGSLGKTRTLEREKGFAADLVATAYGTLDDQYLILYKTYNANGQILLKTSVVSGKLDRIGRNSLVATVDDAAHVCIEGGIVYDEANHRYLASWIERNCGLNSRPAVLKTTLLDKDGVPVSGSSILITKDKGVNLVDIRLFRNPVNAISIVAVKRLKGGSASIAGYAINADGKLLSKKPVIFASSEITNRAQYDSFASVSDGAFSPSGNGLVVWEENPSFDYQHVGVTALALHSNGTPASGAKNIATIRPNSLRVTVIHDPSTNRFLALWNQDIVEAAIIDPATLASTEFLISDSDHFTVPTDIEAAYSSNSQKILIVWNAQCYNPFEPACPGGDYRSAQLRGAIFSGQ
jgi:hypothetical protein